MRPARLKKCAYSIVVLTTQLESSLQCTVGDSQGGREKEQEEKGLEENLDYRSFSMGRKSAVNIKADDGRASIAGNLTSFSIKEAYNAFEN